MGTAPHGDLNPVLASERHGIDDIRGTRAAYDEARTICLHRVERNARVLVPGIGRSERFAAKPHPQVGKRFIRELEALPFECGEYCRHCRLLSSRGRAASLGRLRPRKQGNALVGHVVCIDVLNPKERTRARPVGGGPSTTAAPAVTARTARTPASGRTSPPPRSRRSARRAPTPGRAPARA